MAFSKAIQAREEEMITAVAQDQATAQAIIDLNTEMEAFALSLTKSNGALVTAIRDDLRPAVDKLIEVFSDPSEYLKKILDF